MFDIKPSRNSAQTIAMSAIAIASFAAAMFASSQANAANPEAVTAEVEFVDPLTITEVNALQFGLLDQNLNLETVVIAPNSALTDAGGIVLGGTQAAADLTVAGTASQSITILVDSISNGTGYTLGTVLCSYNSGANTACDGAGMSATSAASATLLIGATLTGNNLAATGVANGSFNVTVSYQ